MSKGAVYNKVVYSQNRVEEATTTRDILRK